MPSTPRRRHFSSLSPHGFHRVVYRDWGEASNPRVLVCVHGLTRNGRDFDVFAEAMSDRWRVLCPDLPGRGESDRLRDPEDYVVPTYCGTVAAMLAHAGAEEIAWVGTSLGGLIGMVLAAQAGTPIRKLVVNDIGPVLERPALVRIAAYVGADPAFASFDELEKHIRQVSATFGPLTDAQWTSLATSTAREMPDGRFRLGYDPGIAIPFASAVNAPADAQTLWPVWDLIDCPTLVTRGEHSDLLSPATALEMQTRGPRARVVEFPGVGHAPMLLDAGQIDPVAKFLDKI